MSGDMPGDMMLVITAILWQYRGKPCLPITQTVLNVYKHLNDEAAFLKVNIWFKKFYLPMWYWRKRTQKCHYCDMIVPYDCTIAELCKDWEEKRFPHARKNICHDWTHYTFKPAITFNSCEELYFLRQLIHLSNSSIPFSLILVIQEIFVHIVTSSQ